MSALTTVLSEQVRVRLHRQVQTQRLFSRPRPVDPHPPGVPQPGLTPVTHFLHDLMTRLNRAYYPSWLSGAELHGTHTDVGRSTLRKNPVVLLCQSRR